MRWGESPKRGVCSLSRGSIVAFSSEELPVLHCFCFFDLNFDRALSAPPLLRNNSQALAGFGIASSAATPDAPRPPPPQDGQGDLFSAFSVGGGGGTFVAGGGAEKGERDRVASVDVSELLRATRLRGGGRRASRPAVRYPPFHPSSLLLDVFVV